jgi:hypothetical protein
VSRLGYKITPDHRVPSAGRNHVPALVNSSGVFDDLIFGLSQIKGARVFPGGAVFQVTACCRGDGVSYIVDRVARDVRICTGDRVLVVPGERLMTLTSGELKQLDSYTVEVSPGVFAVSGERATLLGPVGPIPYEVALDALRKEFAYVFLDCAAMSRSAEAISLAKHADGTLLVIAAGETPVSQVEHAHRMIEHAAGRLLGCVLNKRTYPIPGFLYKRL